MNLHYIMELTDKCLFHAVIIFDNALNSINNLDMNNIELIAITSLFIAAKF